MAANIHIIVDDATLMHLYAVTSTCFYHVYKAKVLVLFFCIFNYIILFYMVLMFINCLCNVFLHVTIKGMNDMTYLN